MITCAPRGKVLARCADEGVEILADGGRAIGVAVAGPETTTQVVDLEGAERRYRSNGLGERRRIEDLRADVHVQPAHRDPVAPLDAGDQLRSGGRREAELGALVPGHDVRVHVGRDTGDHPHEHVLVAADGDDFLEPIDIVGPVDHHQPDPVPHGQGQLVDALRVPVQHDQGRVDTRLERRADLATARHVETEAFLHHHPLDGGAGESLRGEDHPRVRPARRELGPVLARSAAQRGLGDDHHGGAELRGELVRAAACEGQHAVGGDGASRREGAAAAIQVPI